MKYVCKKYLLRESSVKMEINFVKPSEISSANCVYNQYFSRLDIISD